MTTETQAPAAPPVLTSDGRAWLQGRRDRAAARLAQVEEELTLDRSEGLFEERRQLQAQMHDWDALLARAVAPGELRDDPTLVEVGDEVVVELPDRTRETLLIVHPAEAAMDAHRTSSASPLAQAVLGHRPGDRVTVQTPAGVYGCTIVARERSS
ncbi:hypothetical protein ER308_00950 [Egibacter rhizosphaerae]|uniref:Transcription elongation factor GreA/GreB C-terminal domain-containing protein n=1 Tax=Egibacter rhizosphaerae TaxID=1670831 RepID=A0A411YAS5_9ACTN|nr:GreA/GreB family elongation factor [Egibacter rhizosphaerae]QBI18278.1 hypothetical protein ER308_00950 [Egibacter rhizosphaerae]